MTGTLHKLSAGDGYTYLTRQVAAADSTELGRSGLHDYYTDRGERPGQWWGKGLDGLAGRPGDSAIAAGSHVTESQMKALFGEGLHANADKITAAAIAAGATTDQALKQAALGSRFPRFDLAENQFLVEVSRRFQQWNSGHGKPVRSSVPDDVRAQIRTDVGRDLFAQTYGRPVRDQRELDDFVKKSSRPQSQAVAGYDLTFSPVKSVSTLWAIAPKPVSEQVEQAHRAAWASAISWVEDEVSFTRRGAGGVRQVDIHGLITAAFEHRDSRAGDPDLHTHVAISNKVQAVEDGAWLALDGRVLYQAMVGASERYNTELEHQLTHRLGVEFAERAVAAGKRPIREIVGVPTELNQAWSQRRASIEHRQAELATAFEAAHGRTPTPKELIGLAQQANLETREAKHEPRALEDQRSAWRDQATAVLGGPAAVDRVVVDVLQRPRTSSAEISGDRRRELTQQVLRRVTAGRARFRSTHVIAEAQRVARGERVPDPQRLVDELVAEVIGSAETVRLDRVDPISEPQVLRRRSGDSMYDRAHGRLYTTADIVAAEERIVAAAARTDGQKIPSEKVAVALLESEANGAKLNAGQAELVIDLATSGARVQLALAPAGSGKTTAMRALAHAWTSAGGNVIGLAPSAVAAGELGAATGGKADTLAALTYALRDGRALPQWAEQVNAATMVVIDEAGMAGTEDLDAAIAWTLDKGASVRLVGDDQQLAAVAAGGVLRDVATEVGACHLSELMRFHDPAEAEATLRIREGDHAALGFYLDRGRVHIHDTEHRVEAAYDSWLTARAGGADAVMLAPTRDLVDQLNDRARRDRITSGLVDNTHTITLRSGLTAGTGDVVVTRRNDRTLRASTTDWVKNGDRWSVTGLAVDGGLQVRHQRSGRRVTLPADYVREWVDLGYASTVHGAQGMTVDHTSVILDGTESRQLLYVALSRGRATNELYLAPAGDGDPHTALQEHVVHPDTATDVLTGILDRDGAQVSARTEHRTQHDPATILARTHAIWTDALVRAAETTLPAGRLEAITAGAEQLVPGITNAGAWEVLRGHLALIDIGDEDALAALAEAREERELGSALDQAAVLDWRLDPGGHRGGGPLPWLPAAPPVIADDPIWSDYLAGRAEQLRTQAQLVRDRAVELAEEDLPPWARSLAGDRALIGDIAVWRAALNIPDNDTAPLGPARLVVAEARHQRRLQRRIGTHTPTHGQRWVEQIHDREPRVLESDFWPTLARRLDLADRAGRDVAALLDDALAADNPLPEEHPAAALWFRLAGELQPVAALDVPGATRLRPAWTDQLIAELPEGVGARVTRDSHWPALVATINDAAERGIDPGQLLHTSIALCQVDQLDQPGGITLEDLAVMLSWRATQLLTEAGDEALIAEHEIFDPETDLAAEELHTALAPEPAPVDPAAEPPEDPETLPPDPEHEPEPLQAPPGTPRGRVVQLQQAAAAWYKLQYTKAWAADYVRQRFGDDLRNDRAVTIGYAPDGWTGLVDHLTSRGASHAELVDAGLAKYSRRGTLIDVFRDRVMIGLRDQHGDLVGFVGRANPEAGRSVPKYLNTPDTAAFHKGEMLYGLAEQRSALQSGALPVACEGVFDAIAIRRATNGAAAGMAPLGTALTDAQADLLVDAAVISNDQALIGYAGDQDAPGRAAALRAWGKLISRGADPRRLILPGKDPAESLEADGGTAIRTAATHISIAPSLTSEKVASIVGAGERHLQADNRIARIGMIRAAGAAIAAAPPSTWDDEIAVAARMFVSAGTTPTDQADLTHVTDELRHAVADHTSDWQQASPTKQRRATTQDRLARTAEHRRARVAAEKKDRIPTDRNWAQYADHSAAGTDTHEWERGPRHADERDRSL